jgi:hypothetical protein
MRGVSSIQFFALFCAVVMMAAVAPKMSFAVEAPAASKAEAAATETPETSLDAAAAAKAGAQAKAATDAATAKAAGDKEPRNYYERRAKKILENAAIAKDTKPHPLAKDYPDDFVVVCEAGCRGRNVEVVSREPRKPVRVIESGALVTASADGAEATSADQNVMVCLGGCRRGSEVIPSTPQANWTPNSSVNTLSEADIKEFKTTIGPESGRWMDGGAEDGGSATP